MLEDFGTELDSTESKLDSTMKKVAKVLHLSNGKSLYFIDSNFRNIGSQSGFFKLGKNIFSHRAYGYVVRNRILTLNQLSLSGKSTL